MIDRDAGMNMFQTFAVDTPAPSKTLAEQRIDGQDELLDYVEGPLVENVINRTNTQEDELRQVYRRLIAGAKDRVSSSDDMLDSVAGPLFTRLGTNLSTQQAALEGVLAKLPADVRERIVAPDANIAIGLPDAQFVVHEGYPDASPAERVPIIPPLGGWPATPPIFGTEPNPQVPVPPPVVVTTGGGSAACPPTVVNVQTSCPAPVYPPSYPPKDKCPEPEPCPEPEDDEEKEPPPPTPPGVCPPDLGPLVIPLPGEPVCMTAPPATPVLGAVPMPLWDTTAAQLCLHTETFLKGFASVGDTIHTVIAAGLSATADFAGLMAKLKNIKVVGAVFGVLSTPAEVIERILRQVDRVMTDHVKTFCGPRWKELLGLYFTRGFLQSMNSAKIGWNFVITADVTFSVLPNQVLQLVDYLIQHLYPVNIPEMGEIEGLYIRGTITADEAACLASMHGRQRKEFFRNVEVKRPRATPDVYLRYYNRDRSALPSFDATLNQLGVSHAGDRFVLSTMMDELPPPSDAIRFALRDVFDPNKLGLAEMKAEFKQQVGLKEMMGASGIRKTSIIDDTGKTWELDLPLLYFISSYEECSPTQVYEMLHRLRPNRVNRYALPNAAGGATVPDPVSIETVRSLLKEKDYNPIWRDRLAAISFRVPGRIDIRNMYRRGTFGPAIGSKGVDRTDPAKPKLKGVAEVELGERYQDQGYSPDDAAIMVAYDAAEFDRLEGAASRATQLKRICRGYTLGTYDFAGAVKLATPVLGDRQKANEFIGGCDLDMMHRDLELAIAGVKKQWLDGKLTNQDARQLLLGYGVVVSRIDSMMRTWMLIRTVKRRELSAQQISSFYLEGILTRVEAMQRLGNLGFDNKSGNAIIDHAVSGQLAKTRKERERAFKAEERERERRARAVKSEQKERDTAQQRRLTRLLALRTDKNLKEWWSAGEITRDEVRAALLARGAEPKDVETWLRVNDPNKRGADDA